MRAVWQRLTALLSAIVNWRFFKPAVFIACAIPLIDLSYSLWVVLRAQPGLSRRRSRERAAARRW